MAKKKTGKSVKLKEQAVLRLLKGENLELVSRQTGFALRELSRWRDKFIAAGRENLKSRPQHPLHAELEQRDKWISKLALENEILKKPGRSFCRLGADQTEPATHCPSTLMI